MAEKTREDRLRFVGAPPVEDAGRAETASDGTELAPLEAQDTCIDVTGVSLFYSDKQALADISMTIPRRKVTAFIGPSGCGKSTLLRCFNRMNDLIDDVRITGRIAIDGIDINDEKIDVAQLRRRVGMVFQRPNPFPKSIYDNVASVGSIHQRAGSSGNPCAPGQHPEVGSF